MHSFLVCSVHRSDVVSSMLSLVPYVDVTGLIEGYQCLFKFGISLKTRHLEHKSEKNKAQSCVVVMNGNKRISESRKIESQDSKLYFGPADTQQSSLTNREPAPSSCPAAVSYCRNTEQRTKTGQ